MDVPAEGKNVVSLVFKEHEGAYLGGIVAGLNTKSKIIGFVGGMDIPLIHRWETGFIDGARRVDPGIKYKASYVGVTPGAFNDPVKAKEIALSFYEQDCDVILHAAGASGNGVIDAAAEAKNVDVRDIFTEVQVIIKNSRFPEKIILMASAISLKR